jgi:hypothetical protein
MTAVLLCALTPASAAPQMPFGDDGGPGGPGFGGPPPHGRGPHGPRPASAAFVPVETLTAALKLTPAQAAKVRGVQAKLRAGMPRPPRPDGPDGPGREFNPPPPPDFEKMRAQEQAADRDVRAVLTAAQKKALPGLLKEIDDLHAVGIPAGVYPVLRLTAGQKAQVARMARQGHGDATAVLTAAQKKAVAAYERDHPRPGPPPRRFGEYPREFGSSGPGPGRPTT